MAKAGPPLSQEYVRALFDYNPDTGELIWKIRRSSRAGKVQPGMPAGTFNGDYLSVGIDGFVYGVHRIIWLWMTGEWPTIDVEHEDQNKKNNRWLNLRLATRSQNNMNVGLRSDNTTGVKGVGWSKDRNKWVAHIGVNGKLIMLGRFDAFEEACRVRRAAEIEHYGEFAPDPGPIPPPPEVEIRAGKRRRTDPWTEEQRKARSKLLHNPNRSSRNTSGCKGVGFNKTLGRWFARFAVEGRLTCKYAKSFEDAVALRKSMEAEYHASQQENLTNVSDAKPEARSAAGTGRHAADHASEA